MDTQFEILDIPMPPLSEANLSAAEYEKVSRRIEALAKFDILLPITYSWQLKLLTGNIEFFREYLNKKDDQDRNIAFYGLCAESKEVLQWIFKEQSHFIENYLSSPMEEDINPGIDAFIKDFTLISAFLKSMPLFDWILNAGHLTFFSRKQKEMFLFYIAASDWIEGLDKINQINPSFIRCYGKTVINIAIKGRRSNLFQWVTLHLHDQLMVPEFFGKSTTYGMLAAVNWFLKFAPPEILDYRDEDGINIVHLAGVSKSNRVFDAITEFKKDSLNDTDHGGRRLIEYALNSLNLHRISKALELCENSEQLDIVATPTHFHGGKYHNGVGGLADTVNNLLDFNFNLQIIRGNRPPLEEIHLKLQRNKIIGDFEKIKPIIVTFLAIKYQQNNLISEVPLEVITSIVLLMLPQNVSEETINSYRQNFFFKNNNISRNIGTVSEEDDSQEEIECLGSDSY